MRAACCWPCDLPRRRQTTRHASSLQCPLLPISTASSLTIATLACLFLLHPHGALLSFLSGPPASRLCTPAPVPSSFPPSSSSSTPLAACNLIAPRPLSLSFNTIVPVCCRLALPSLQSLRIRNNYTQHSTTARRPTRVELFLPPITSLGSSLQYLFIRPPRLAPAMPLRHHNCTSISHSDRHPSPCCLVLTSPSLDIVAVSCG